MYTEFERDQIVGLLMGYIVSRMQFSKPYLLEMPLWNKTMLLEEEYLLPSVFPYTFDPRAIQEIHVRPGEFVA
jgi:hypothetical protein